jgi:hypothetical protein
MVRAGRLFSGKSSTNNAFTSFKPARSMKAISTKTISSFEKPAVFTAAKKMQKSALLLHAQKQVMLTRNIN